MSLERKLPLKRHVIALKEKIEILDKLKEGVKISTLAKSLNLHEATIRTIKKNEEKIRENVLAGCSTTSKRMDCARDLNVVKMEEALAIWIEDCNDKRILLDGLTIRQKALNIYKYLKEMASSSGQQQQKSFCASKGWFEKFKTRYSLRSLKLQGESASADAEAAGFFTLDDGEYTEYTIVDENAENYPEDTSPKISVTDVQQGLDLAKKLELHFMEIDPSLSRKRTFQQNLKTCLGPYLKFVNTMENKRVPPSNINYENVSSDDEFLSPRRKRIRILDDNSDQEISIDKDPLSIQKKTNQSLESDSD